MKKTRFLITILLIPLLLVCSSAFAGQSLKFKPKKPFAGKFQGNIESNGYSYKIIYNISMSGTSISGTVDTYLNDVLVLPLNVSGTVDMANKTADITLSGADGSSPSEAGYTPSDYVRITLIGNGKNKIKMQYLDSDGGTGVGDVVKYKRLLK